MSEIYSNSFTSKVNKPSTSTSSTIYSNTFSTTINKTVVEETSNTTQINIWNGTTQLAAVNTSPSAGQYKVTITDTINCTARLENDYKTITLLTVTGNAGEIHITIDIEGKTTINKTIPVASITKSSSIKTQLSKFEQDLSGFKTTVAETYATNSRLGEINENLATSITKVEQTANKINWLVKSGDSSSNMTLTNDALSVITKQVKVTGDMIVDGAIDGKTITGATIIGSTFKNQNDTFSVDSDGNIVGATIIGSTFKNQSNTFSVDSDGNIVGAQIQGSEVIGDSFSVEGELTADVITANKINGGRYPGTLEDDIQINISSASGNDDNELYDNVIFATIGGALDALPKFLNGKKVDIWVQENINENIDFQYFSSGRINLYLDSHTVYGYIRSYMSSVKVNVYGGYIGGETSGLATIHPPIGCAVAGRTGSFIAQENSSMNGYNLKIYGSDNLNPNGTSATVGVIGDAFGTSYIKDVVFVNCNVGFRGSAGGRIHDAASSGVCSQYGYQATSGAFITIANASHCGGKTGNTSQTLPGQIIAHGNASYAGGNQTTDDNKAPTTTTTKTVTIKSNSGDTYRSSVYNSWKKDNTARQGDYGYGDCNGCWFFGTQFNQFKGKSIKKIELTIKRISGGAYAAVPLVVKTHNYASRPSGKPSYGSSCGTVKIAVGDSGKLTITNSTILNALSNGSIKGFGIQSAYSSGNYAVCSGSVTMKVTYTE